MAQRHNFMEIENKVKNEKISKMSRSKQHLMFFLVLFVLVGGGVVRSAIATRLDSFKFDEAYHIGAGVAYIRTGDFRLNPEHPPLIKLWVGAFVSSAGYQLSNVLGPEREDRLSHLDRLSRRLERSPSWAQTRLRKWSRA